LTFREVDERVNRLANGLLGLGLKRGDRIAALQDNSPQAIEVRFALMKAGLCMVALNVRQAPEEQAHIIQHSESRCLILDADYLPAWLYIKTQCPTVQHVIIAGEEALADNLHAYEKVIDASPSDAPEVMVSPDDLERIAYTSGTTGRPKGIMKTIANDMARLRLDFMNEDRLTTADDVMLNVAPLTHAARVFFRKHYLKGARNIILRRFSEQTVLDTIQHERVTTTMLVPTMLIRLTQYPQVKNYDVSSLQRVFFGTAPIPADKWQQAIQLFGNVFRQNYGMSEATQPVLSLTPADLASVPEEKRCRRLASAGRPALGIEVRLVDEQGHDVSQGQEGELIIRSATVMQGYWNDPQATRAAIDAQGWLHTDDVAQQDDEGFFYIVGRQKEMIISGGFNIYPREVEQVIESHQGVQEVAVIGIPDDIWGETVKALVVPKPGSTITEADILALCQQHIASYKKPRSVDIVDRLPKNFQGKIIKRLLRERIINAH
jgi:acyl-CoA synthetase (AMP-forming)/AMP-acid ligase II